MSRTTLWLLASLVACGAAALSGCALDPMDRLSEDIDAEEVQTRQAAVFELADLRDDRAIEALVEVLESDEDVYDLAGVALVKQGRETVTEEKPDPVLTMVAGIMNNVHLPDANRARAAWVLGEIGDREAIPALRAGDDAVTVAAVALPLVREQAVAALKKLGAKNVGQKFDLPMGYFRDIQAELAFFPEEEVQPLVTPVEEELEEGEEGEEAAAGESEEGEVAEEEGEEQLTAEDETEGTDEDGSEAKEDEAEPDGGGDDEDEDASETAARVGPGVRA